MITISISGVPFDFPEKKMPLLMKDLVMEAVAAFHVGPEHIRVAVYRTGHPFSMRIEDIFSLEAIEAENMFQNPVFMRGRIIHTIKRYPRLSIESGEPRILRRGRDLCMIRERTFRALPGCGIEMLEIVRRIMRKNELSFKSE